MRTLLIPALVLCTVAGSAAAQSAPGFSGYIQADMFSEDLTMPFATAEIDYASGPDAFGSAMAIGFEASIGAAYYGGDFILTGSAGLTMPLGGGTLSVGIPQSAYDRYAPRAPFAYSMVLGPISELGLIMGSFTNFGQLLGIYAPGVRYDGMANGVEYSLSYHQFLSPFDTPAIAAGGRYDMGSFVISGGAEVVLDGPTAMQGYIGVEGMAGGGQYTVQLTQSLFEGTILSGSYDYDISDNVTVGVSAVGVDGLSYWLTGGYARYAMSSGAYVQAGGFMSGLGDPAFFVSAGMAF